MEVLEVEWDEDNLEHCGRHGVTPSIVEELVVVAPLYFPGKAGRTATHAVIAPALDGRFWTVHILETGIPGRWRPITGWPSTGSERKLYDEAKEAERNDGEKEPKDG